MLILIDNYDSFTYNLVHFLGELGASCRVFRNDKISVAEVMKLAPKGVNDGSELQRHAGSRRYLPAAGAEEPTDAFSALITLSVMSCFGLM